MKEGQRSRTAERVAVRRAAHQLFDAPLILDDPVALRIIDPADAERLRASPDEARDRTSVAMRAFMAVRSRFAEDTLARAVDRGTRQYVVLGAGLDTFACRNPWERLPLRVFEVDYPATQRWKRERLQQAGIAVPPTLTFAPVNFEDQTIAEGLTAAGWNSAEPTFFSWLGVTMYLTAGAIDSTLRFIASLPSSGVVFDYSVDPALLGMRGKAVYYFLAARVAAAGEPWVSTFEPAKLVSHLADVGFGRVESATAEMLNARYCAGRQDALQVSGMAQMMVGWSSSSD